EAAKDGISDDFARRAIAHYGKDNAIHMREAMKDPDSFDEFRSLFGTDHNKDLFEMEIVDKEVIIDDMISLWETHREDYQANHVVQ
ncbi:MAG: hypothetical protein II432_07095, partial [Erysipelotrichaceae bacterium]|nr:hypothetical protein [Erysipelotrichaceae bacterium]